MKKRCLFPFLLSLLLLLCSCGQDQPSTPALTKAQEVQVIPAGQTSPTRTLTQQEDLDALIRTLDPDHWTTAALPQGLTPAGTLLFSRAATQKAGKPADNETLYELCQIQLYADAPYLTLTAVGLSLTFFLPDTTSEALSSLFA